MIPTNHATDSIRFFFNRYAFTLLLLGIILAYSNSLDCAWQWDDYPNIVFNPSVHAEDLSPATINKAVTLQNNTSHVTVFRPVAFLTFAFNWHFGQLDVVGFHLVNIAIHLLNTVLLYLALLFLLRALPNQPYTHAEIKVLALIATALWALNPIQTQTVTYIVQRMASLCTLFYLSAILAYLQARRAKAKRHQRIWISVCLVAFVLSMGSKENAAVLPLSLLLVEACFFGNLKAYRLKEPFVARWCIGICLAVCVAGLLIILAGDPLSLFAGYKSRVFSLYERLLTQPRIIFFYLSQLFYPVSDRLSLIHDVQVSTSLLTPWTTLPAIIGLIAMTVLAFFSIRTRPIISFSFLFFLANHLVESTILPLELIFEHRNYLPSLFLFIPIAEGALFVYRRYKTQRIIKGALILIMGAIAFSLGLGTYARNLDWKSAQSLWSDAMRKAPQSAAPLINLATAHYQLRKEWDTALRLNQIALTKWDATPNRKMFTCLSNIGAMYLMKKEYANAIRYATQALNYNPDGLAAIRILGVAHYNAGQSEKAITRFNYQISKGYRMDEASLYKFKIYFKDKNYFAAKETLRQRLKLMPSDGETLYLMGITLHQTDHFRQADWFLSRAVFNNPQALIYRLWRIENLINTGNSGGLNAQLKNLFSLYSLNAIFESIEKNLGKPDNPERLNHVNQEWVSQSALQYLK